MTALDDADGPLTPKQLVERTGLKRRTLYFALECLSQRNAIKRGMSLRDARSRLYAIQDDMANGAWKNCVVDGNC